MCFALSAPSSRTANGGLKQRRVYELDEDGNRIRDQNGEFVFNAVPTTDWGSPETLEYWRQTWAELCNAKFAEKGFDVRIDHRSYERQGVELLPTVHEGATVRAMEKKGIRTEKGEFNRWIRATNAVIRDIKKKIALLFDWIAEAKSGACQAAGDMYPLYWTPSRGGIIMRYTYEYKRKCVELYREGKWPETPEGVSDKSFRDKVRLWVRAEDSRGPEALKHKNFNRNWTPEERLELVSQVMSGKSCVSVAIEAGIQDRLLYQWVQNYKTKGYNGLVEMKKGRPSKGVPQMKKEEARPLNESEREELIRLRAENEYIKAENEVIKKELALREERHAAQLKARKQRSSKSCVKKDTN